MERFSHTPKQTPDYLESIKSEEVPASISIILVVIGINNNGAAESVFVGKQQNDNHCPCQE